MCAVYCAFVSLLQGIFSFVLSLLSALSIPISPLASLTIDTSGYRHIGNRPNY